MHSTAGEQEHAGEPLRVLFASTHSYLPQRFGGIESCTHDLCLEIRRAGHKPAVLATIEPRGALGLTNRIRRKLPFGPHFPGDGAMGYPVYRGWLPAKGAPELLRRFRPAVVVAQGTGPVPLARAFLELGVPTFLYLYDLEFDRLGGAIPSDPRLSLLAISRFTAERARSDLGVDAHVLLPLIRPDAYRTETSREVVLFINPHPWKGVDIAFRIAESRPDIPFVFLESWKLRDELKREYLARAAELPNVTWSDPVRDMRKAYSRARVVLAPSVWEEAWGRVATEPHISGIPVLASNRGGLPESVGPGGILVDSGAPVEAWTAALSRLWDEDAEYERLSQAALEYSRRPEIQPQAIAARFVELAAAHARSCAASG